MKNKPITPEMHCIMDYAMSATLITLPSMLGMNKTARNTYCSVGASILSLNATTDVKGAVKKMVPLKTHKKADLGLLLGTLGMTFMKPIWRDKKALAFHVGFLALATTQYLLTDFDSGTV
ncbi:MAG TPA: hypothetical protein VF676_00640 [Flavobacterium sp.]